MSVRPLRVWESDDPQYRWSIVVGGEDAPRLRIYTDPIPTVEGARLFGRMLIEAADYQESAWPAPFNR